MQPSGPSGGSGPRIAPAGAVQVQVTRTEERTRSLLFATLSTLAAIAVVWFLSWAKGLLIPLSFALLLAASLTPAVTLLARAHVPRAIGAAVVLLALSSLIGVAVSRTRGDLVQMVDQVPAAARYVRREVRRSLEDPRSIAHRLAILANLPATAGAAPTTTRAAPAAAATSVFAEGTQVISLTGELAAVLFLVYLLLASGGRLQRRLTAHEALPPALRVGAGSVYTQFEQALHRYLGVLFLSNVLMGLAIWGTFHLFAVHRAGAWGVAAGLAHFVPYVGPALFAVGTGLFASVQFNSLAQGLIIAGSTLVLSSLIGVGLQTWLMGRSVRMNTVAVFVSLLFWSWLWGLPGLLLGTPITVGLKVICHNIRRLEWIDALLEDHRREPGSAVGRVILRGLQRAERSVEPVESADPRV